MKLQYLSILMVVSILVILSISLVPSFAIVSPIIITADNDGTIIKQSPQITIIQTDKSKYYAGDSIIINGEIVDVDWLKDTTINYNILNPSYISIGSGVSNSLQQDGTFSFMINWSERELWGDHSQNILFVISIQESEEGYLFYSSTKPNMTNEANYEKIMINNNIISDHDPMIYSNEFMINNLEDMFEELITPLTISTDKEDYVTNNIILIYGEAAESQGNPSVTIKLTKNNIVIYNDKVQIIDSTYSLNIQSDDTWEDGTYIISAQYKNSTSQITFEFISDITPLGIDIVFIEKSPVNDRVYIKIHGNPPDIMKVEMYSSKDVLFASLTMPILHPTTGLAWGIGGTIPYDTYTFIIENSAGFVSVTKFEYVQNVESAGIPKISEPQSKILQKHLEATEKKIERLDISIQNTTDPQKLDGLLIIKGIYQNIVNVIVEGLWIITY